MRFNLTYVLVHTLRQLVSRDHLSEPFYAQERAADEIRVGESEMEDPIGWMWQQPLRLRHIRQSAHSIWTKLFL